MCASEESSMETSQPDMTGMVVLEIIQIEARFCDVQEDFNVIPSHTSRAGSEGESEFYGD